MSTAVQQLNLKAFWQNLNVAMHHGVLEIIVYWTREVPISATNNVADWLEGCCWVANVLKYFELLRPLTTMPTTRFCVGCQTA